jgi:hypothetical protein
MLQRSDVDCERFKIPIIINGYILRSGLRKVLCHGFAIGRVGQIHVAKLSGSYFLRLVMKEEGYGWFDGGGSTR